MRKIPNTFGIDVTAARFLEYGSEDELRELIAAGHVVAPWLHIGGGSNLLFIKDYEGTVLHSRIGGLEVTSEDEEHVSVRVGAGVIWDDFVAYCVERRWYGAENLSLIPGEVADKAMYRVIVNSFADKTAAAEARDAFKAKYPNRSDFQGAWLLYRVY